MNIYTDFHRSSVVDNSESAEVNAIKYLHIFYIYLIYIFCNFYGFLWPMRYATHVLKFAILNSTELPKNA